MTNGFEKQKALEVREEIEDGLVDLKDEDQDLIRRMLASVDELEKRLAEATGSVSDSDVGLILGHLRAILHTADKLAEM